MPGLLSHMRDLRAHIQEESLLAAAAYIALKGEEGGPETGFPWREMGHWRLVPAIKLLWEEELHQIKYRRFKGNEEIRFQLAERECTVILDHRKGHLFRLRINNKPLEVWGIRDGSEIHMDVNGQRFTCRRPDIPDRRFIPRERSQKGWDNGEISAPLNGRVVEIPVKDGDRVEKGSALVIIESMKMENRIISDREAIVAQIEVTEGQQVRTNQLLMTLDSL
jgi:biotin carboxyl carrier protein